MDETKFILAIDLGTSGPKVALVGDDGTLTGSDFEPVELLLLPGGGAEQDPNAWWSAIVAATKRTLAAKPDAEVTAVCVTSQWSGTVAIGHDGNAIGNAIVWMDTRGAGYVEKLIGGPVQFQGYDPRKARKWVSLTGGAPSGAGKDPIAHILWLRNERPDVYRSTRVFLEPKDYINYRLTGEVTATFDSITLHWVTDNRDPNAVTYDDDLLAYAGLDRSVLPDLLPATAVVGGLAESAATDLGLPAGIPVLGGTPDLHSAAIGSGTTGDVAGSLYIGTSSWIVCHVPFKKTDLIHNIASLPAAIPGRYLV
ncbi:MAG: FGGY family carbohydrate kinase, partial [Acidimicrobiia bacterium]